jgi:hypothetical protein
MSHLQELFFFQENMVWGNMKHHTGEQQRGGRTKSRSQTKESEIHIRILSLREITNQILLFKNRG